MMPQGIEVYNTDSGSVVARGLLFQDTEYSVALRSVLPILDDEEGTNIIHETLGHLATTGFMQDNLSRLLSQGTEYEDWRIGEALAEKYLIDHHQCNFPWPGGRDLKNPASSPAGCDLVGFQVVNGTFRFTFGEVKTSYQETYPPSVVTSRHGLAEQLFDLRNNSGIKDALVKYLGYHAQNSEWLNTYQEAAKHYLADACDVSLFGFLIRDVTPNLLDLRAKARALSTNCPQSTSIQLKALYFPLKKIVNFPRDLDSIRREQS